ncbi:multidrug export protein EmrA [Mergibacter septicus]|uniref:EmrA/EmrK family multidrug efflux transporter periplasmic adaptor subunit n=1 Tax=Mergibacter septicus TaxID=221402 RepID=UPI0011791E44|nr:EmrA/EmrK family multidrug efflux transporter periplasmic adaptor subunit [Mergibacter septicus]AWX13610.1 multidrug export protein EmrA [Mergibacter septicus]
MTKIEQQQKSQGKRQLRTKRLAIFTVILIIVAIISFGYWFFFVKDFAETNDAYSNGNIVPVSTQVTGNIRQINYIDTDLVHKGDVLVILDDTDAKLALSQAKNNLALAVRHIAQARFTAEQLRAAVAAKKVLLHQAERDLARRQKLDKAGAVAKESLQHSQDAVLAAKNDLAATQDQLNATLALLGTSSLEQQPAVIQAADKVRQAWLNLQRTKILSPVDGYIARRNAQVGQLARPGIPLMAVVPLNQIWLDANFKETQIKPMRIGQPVKIWFDLYGKEIKFDGKIEGIEAGTGNVFSLLPAQNATGNWIKVVQRLPVRISLDPKQLEKYPLRLGLSATVKVNLSHQDGEVLAKKMRGQPLYQTNTLDYDLTPINTDITTIIRNNSY